MPFVRSFVRVDRWLDWKVVMPVYDGRQCPECAAAVVGRKGQKAHQEWHTRRTEFDSTLLAAVRKMALKMGLNPVEMRPGDTPDGLYDVDEDQDERLTRKARQVAELDDYDEEDDDGEL
jgi:hypothetical protein